MPFTAQDHQSQPNLTVNKCGRQLYKQFRSSGVNPDEQPEQVATNTHYFSIHQFQESFLLGTKASRQSRFGGMIMNLSGAMQS